MRKSRLRAITTRYKNHSFRSRLEARYAVYFDHLGIKWEYEPEGFELGNGLRYLPDFWLPEWGIWIEVKPVAPDAAGVEKARRLAAGHSAVLMLVGEPKAELHDQNRFFGWDSDMEFRSYPAGSFAHFKDELHLQVAFSFSKDFYSTEAKMRENDSIPTFSHHYDDVDWSAAEAAVTAALSARFEFGANGGAQ